MSRLSVTEEGGKFENPCDKEREKTIECNIRDTDARTVYRLPNRVSVNVFLVVLLSACLIGCEGQVRLPSAEQLAEFEDAGPSVPSIDLDRLVKAKMNSGPYRVVPGDVLELTMSAILQVVTAEEAQLPDRVASYVCRVSEIGTITLPVVGDIEVARKSLAEIELAVIEAYYPMYTATRPSVVARVIEYRKARVSITGAVDKPGVYELRSDQMSLVTLIMQAGGIVDEGAANIRIIHSDSASEDALYKQLAETYKELIETLGLENPQEGVNEADLSKLNRPDPIILPVRGLNIPFADVALRDGDTVVVERMEQPFFTVIGLVNKPGNFPYPPQAKYNLMQALAFAGGLDKVAEPRYATIYRLKVDGTIVNATFRIVEDSMLTDALNTVIKPGDIIDVAQTPRTRRNVFLERIFHVNFGAYAPVFR